MAAFTLPALSPAEPRNQQREMLQRLGAARDRLWIAEPSHITAERNCCTIGGTMNMPVEDAAISPDSPPLASRGFRLMERI
jgi:hypothetical protein